MSVSCGCDFEPSPGETWYWHPHSYTTLQTKRPRKCCSCTTTIRPGDTCARVPRQKAADCAYEYSRFPDGEVPRAPWWMCERCADLLFSLDELGYCVDITEDIHDQWKEYQDERTGHE